MHESRQRANIVRMDDAFIQFRFNNRAVAFRNSLSRAFAKSSSDAASSISRPMAQPLDGTKKEIIMRKIFIVAAGLACLVSLAGPASAVPLQMSPGDLKNYCAKKGGEYYEWDSGGVSCEIGSGKTKVTIDCTASGNCNMSHTTVLTKLKPSIIGNSGYSISASGNANSSATAKATAAGGASVASSASASTDLFAGGTANTKKASVNAATNTGVAIGTRKVVSGGGAMPSIGRPALRQQ